MTHGERWVEIFNVFFGNGVFSFVYFNRRSRGMHYGRQMPLSLAGLVLRA